MANYAAGLGGLMSGFAQGMKIGKELRSEYDNWETQKAAKAAVEEGKKKYQEAIAQREAEMTGANTAPGATNANGVTVTPIAQRDMRVENMPPADGATAPAQPQQPTPAPSAPVVPPAETAPAQPATAPVAAQGITPKQAVTERVIETPAPSATGIADAAKQTAAIAVGDVGSERDAISKAVTSRMRDHYMQRGDMGMVEKWEQYSETQDAKRQMTHFGKALRSAAVGDHDGVIKNIMPVLNDFYGDGFKIHNSSPVKDKEGNITGYNFDVRNTRTGEVTKNNLTNEKLYEVAMTMGTPQQGFERWLKTRQANDKAKQEAAAEAGKIKMQTAKDIAVEQAKQGGRVQLEGVKNQHQTARDASQHEQRLDVEDFKSKLPGPLGKKLQDAQAAGATPEQVNQMISQEIEGNTKKVTDPVERKSIIMTNLAAKYVDMQGRPTKTPEELSAIADQYIRLAYGAPRSATDTGKPTTTPPAAKGIGTPQAFRDNKTGKVVYFGADGKPIPQ